MYGQNEGRAANSWAQTLLAQVKWGRRWRKRVHYSAVPNPDDNPDWIGLGSGVPNFSHLHWQKDQQTKDAFA